MTYYRLPITVPDHIAAYMAPFIGQGSLKIADENTLTWTVEADNLWDLSTSAHEVAREADANSAHYGTKTTVGEPSEVQPPSAAAHTREIVEGNIATVLEEMVSNILTQRGADFANNRASNEGWRADRQRVALATIMRQIDILTGRAPAVVTERKTR